jgi:hypothetical protein
MHTFSSKPWSLPFTPAHTPYPREPFDAQYRCHLKGEPQMHYLKYFVIAASAAVILHTLNHEPRTLKP